MNRSFGITRQVASQSIRLFNVSSLFPTSRQCVPSELERRRFKLDLETIYIYGEWMIRDLLTGSRRVVERRNEASKRIGYSVIPDEKQNGNICEIHFESYFPIREIPNRSLILNPLKSLVTNHGSWASASLSCIWVSSLLEEIKNKNKTKLAPPIDRRCHISKLV